MNNTFGFDYTNATEGGKKYWWKVEATSYGITDSAIYDFTLAVATINHSSPYPADGGKASTSGEGINILTNHSLGYRMRTDIWTNASGAWVLYGSWDTTWFGADHDHDGDWETNDVFDAVTNHQGWSLNGTSAFENNNTETDDMGMTSYNTQYWWSINTTDGDIWKNDTYSLSTVYIEFNLSGERPTNGSVNFRSGDYIHSDYFQYVSALLNVELKNTTTMTIRFYENTTGSWVLQWEDSGHGNGTYGFDYVNATSYGKTYWWMVNISSGARWETHIYNFILDTPSIVHTNPYPSDGATAVPISGVGINIDTNHSWGWYRMRSDVWSNASGAWVKYGSWNSTTPFILDYEYNGYWNAGDLSYSNLHTGCVFNGTSAFFGNASFTDNIGMTTYGTKYWWSINSTDGGLWQNDTYSLTTDTEHNPPTSSATAIAGYWKKASDNPLTISATANDDFGVAEVYLYYSYSSDNISWGGWVNYTSDAVAPYTFSFLFDNGTGHYRFYTRAVDTSSNWETAPVTYDTECGYDTVNPTSSVSLVGDGAYVQSDAVIDITATNNDATSGINHMNLFYRYANDNITWGSWTDYGATYGSTWFFNNPDGLGYYEVYSRATDNAGNYETAPGSADIIFRYAPGISVTNPVPANGTTIYPVWRNWTVDISSMGTFNWTIQCHAISNDGTFTPQTVIDAWFDYSTNGTYGVTGNSTAPFLFYDYDYVIYVNVTNSFGFTKKKIYHLLTDENIPVAPGTPNPTNNSIGVSLAVNWTIPLTKDVRDTLIDYNYIITCYDHLGALVDFHFENTITVASHNGYLFLFGLQSNETYTINLSVMDWYGAANHSLGLVWVNRTYYFTTMNASSYAGWWDDDWRAKKMIKWDVTEQEAEGLQVLVNISKGAYGASDDLMVYPPRIVVNSSNLGECRFIARYFNTTTMLEEFTVLPIYFDVIQEGMFIHYANEQPSLWSNVNYMHVWIKLPKNTGDKEYNWTAGEVWVYWKNLYHLPYPGATLPLLTLSGNGTQVFDYFVNYKSSPVGGWFSDTSSGDDKVATHFSSFMSNGSGLDDTGRRIRMFQQMLKWDWTTDNHNHFQEMYLANDNIIAPSEKLGLRVALYTGYTPPVMDEWSNLSGGAPYSLAGDAHLYGGVWTYSTNKTGAGIYSESGDVLLTGGPQTIISTEGGNYTSEDGDVYVDGTVAHISHGSGYGKAYYIFDIAPTTFQDDTSAYKALLASIYYDEISPLGDGPDIYVYKYSSPTGWKKWASNVGGWPTGAPYAWSSDYGCPSPYTSNDFIYNVGGIGRMAVYVYSSGGDETNLGVVRLKYIVAGSETVAVSSEGSGTGYVTYQFDIGALPPVAFDIGVNFADIGTIWHGGPDLYVWDWNTDVYDTVQLNMGEQDVYTWIWYSVGGTVTDYVSTGQPGEPGVGYIRFKVFADHDDWSGGDNTWIANTGLRHMHTGTEAHLSEGPTYGYALYNFTLTSTAVEEGMIVGVYYRELSLDGPDLYLYNFDTSTWDYIRGNLGGGDHSVVPIWTTINPSNAYVSDTGYVLVEIFSPNDFLWVGDNTQVTALSINYAAASGTVPGTGNARVSLVDTVGGAEDETAAFFMQMSDDPTNPNTYHFYDLIWYNQSAAYKNISLNVFDFLNNNLWVSGPPASSNVGIDLFNRYGLRMSITEKWGSTHSRTYGWSSNMLWIDSDANYLFAAQDEMETSYPYFAIGKYVWRDNYTEPVVTSTLQIELPYFWEPYPDDGATDIPINPTMHGYSLGGFGGLLKTDWYLYDPVFGYVFKQTNLSIPHYVSWSSSGDCDEYKTTYIWRVIVSDMLGNTFTGTYTFTTNDVIIANFTFTIIDYDLRRVQFNDTSFSTMGIDYYNWLFAHSSSSNKQNPLYTFGSAGNWSVTLTIENSTSHKRASVTKYVDLSQPASPEHFIIDLDWSMFVPWMYIIICIAMIWITMQFFNRLWRKRK
jgi:hypothetical protein